MNDRSALRRSIKAYRNFGLGVATRVAYSKIRGKLFPALALSDMPVNNASLREVSVLFSTAEQCASIVNAVVEVFLRQDGGGWEVCICERIPVEPEMARTLVRVRGTQPWIRIVTTDNSVDGATAARWTVEQATGQFVALVAPGYVPKAEALARLVARLRTDPGLDAAVLVRTDSAPGSALSRGRLADCRLVLQRKSRYLEVYREDWPLTALALAKDLDKASVPTAYEDEELE